MISLLRWIDGFSPGARLDWLHTTHGKFPDLAAEYDTDNGIFIVGVWDCSTSWVCAVEGPDDVHSGILMTYRWFRNKNEIWCSADEGEEFSFKVTKMITKNIMDQIARESIHVYITTDLP